MLEQVVTPSAQLFRICAQTSHSIKLMKPGPDGRALNLAAGLFDFAHQHELVDDVEQDLARPHRLAARHVTVEVAMCGPLLMVTDPPYGVEYDPSWRNQAGETKTKRTGKVLNDDRADWREAWALFPGDVAYVWHGALHAATVTDSLVVADFAIRSQIIRAKDRIVLSRGDYHWQHEPCWYAVCAKGNDSLSAAALVWSNAPVIVGAHDTGPLIRSRNGFWLAIPTPAAGKSTRGGRITPRRMGAPHAPAAPVHLSPPGAEPAGG